MVSSHIAQKKHPFFGNKRAPWILTTVWYAYHECAFLWEIIYSRGAGPAIFPVGDEHQMFVQFHVVARSSYLGLEKLEDNAVDREYLWHWEGVKSQPHFYRD